MRFNIVIHELHMYAQHIFRKRYDLFYKWHINNLATPMKMITRFLAAQFVVTEGTDQTEMSSVLGLVRA